MLFETLATTGHEQVVFCHNKDAGLKAIIAIHNTVLGPALGGTRMWPYKTEAEALNDVLRLSRGMTYKNAVAGLNIGGGKAVIIGDPAKDKSEALFRAFGRFVNSLGGRYITAEDVGIDVNDMEYVFRETEFVTGVHQVHGGSGDPSPFTAFGTLQGLMAALNHKHGNEDVGKYSFAVQGLGHVGMEFVKLLREQGAKVFVTDIHKDRVQRAVDEHGCTAVASTRSTMSTPTCTARARWVARSTTRPSTASRPRSSVVRPTTSSPTMRSATNSIAAAWCMHPTTRSMPVA